MYFSEWIMEDWYSTKVKVKLFLLTQWRQVTKPYGLPVLILVLDAGEWSTSCSVCFMPRERTACTHCPEVWVVYRHILDILERLFCPSQEAHSKLFSQYPSRSTASTAKWIYRGSHRCVLSLKKWCTVGNVTRVVKHESLKNNIMWFYWP